jgi:hypothetical protein
MTSHPRSRRSLKTDLRSVQHDGTAYSIGIEVTIAAIDLQPGSGALYLLTQCQVLMQPKLAETPGIRDKTKNLIYPPQVLAGLLKGGKIRSMTSHPRSRRSLTTNLKDPPNTIKTLFYCQKLLYHKVAILVKVYFANKNI